MPPASTKARRKISKHLAERTPRVGPMRAIEEVLEAILAEHGWDDLLLALANQAFARHAKLRGVAGKSLHRRVWLRRCKVLHNAMEFERNRRKFHQRTEEESNSTGDSNG